MIEYLDLDQTQKEHLRAQAQRLPRGAEGATFGNPAHLLDAATYVKRAWDAVSPTTICNAFKKAEIIQAFLKEEERDEEDELDHMFAEVIQDLSSYNITVTEEDMNEFLDRDNENNIEYIDSVMEDVNDLLNSSEAAQNANIENSDDENEAANENEAAKNYDDNDDDKQVPFVGFSNLSEGVLSLQDQLLCKKNKYAAGEKYDMIMTYFSSF